MTKNAGAGNLGVIITASLAGLLFGFDTVVMSGVTQYAAGAERSLGGAKGCSLLGASMIRAAISH
jgi:hypothetical protein